MRTPRRAFTASPRCFLGGKRGVVKQALVLVFVEVWNVVFIFLLAEAALTAVAGDILAVAGKAVACEETVVGTSLTSCQL